MYSSLNVGTFLVKFQFWIFLITDFKFSINFFHNNPENTWPALTKSSISTKFQKMFSSQKSDLSTPKIHFKRHYFGHFFSSKRSILSERVTYIISSMNKYWQGNIPTRMKIFKLDKATKQHAKIYHEPYLLSGSVHFLVQANENFRVKNY